MLLEGKQIKISAPILRKYIGTKVQILLYRDIDNRRGGIYPFITTIDDIFGRNIVTPTDTYYFTDIKEIAEIS